MAIAGRNNLVNFIVLIVGLFFSRGCSRGEGLMLILYQHHRKNGYSQSFFLWFSDLVATDSYFLLDLVIHGDVS
jgi:hypothetical protein